MGQTEQLMEKIDEICGRIWGTKEVETQEIGIFVQDLYPDLISLLPIITEKIACYEGEQKFMAGINHIMEGLQWKDHLLLADAFYYEIKDVLKCVAEMEVNI